MALVFAACCHMALVFAACCHMALVFAKKEWTYTIFFREGEREIVYVHSFLYYKFFLSSGIDQ